MELEVRTGVRRSRLHVEYQIMVRTFPPSRACEREEALQSVGGAR